MLALSFPRVDSLEEIDKMDIHHENLRNKDIFTESKLD